VFEEIKLGFAASHNAKLVDELLEAYAEIKRNYYLGGLRLAEVEGGRFCEAAFRILEERTKGNFTALGNSLDSERLITYLANIPPSRQPESVRLHIPRALRILYDIRNKRDAAHLADQIDPNLQDATLVMGVADWVLAEFVRLYHNVTPEVAQRMVDDLVTRGVPAIQDFQGFLKVLNPKLQASDHVLLLLYQRGDEGATYNELLEWSKPSMRANLKKTLGRLTHERAFVHDDGERYIITRSGMREVETQKLYNVP
jgi:hypothetical protein